jgi:hypothetical protein
VKNKFDELIMILILLVLGLSLLPQYQRPALKAFLEKVLGPPPAAKPAGVPGITLPALTTTTRAPVPAPARLPRDYDGIKFLSGYSYVRGQVMDKYEPIPKGQSRQGGHFVILSEGPGSSAGTKVLALEYSGDPSAGYPRFLTFLFHQGKLVKVAAKYFKSDPDSHLKKIMDKYGDFRYQEMLEGRDKYTWDDGGMQIVLEADRAGGVTVFTLQMKKFAELR